MQIAVTNHAVDRYRQRVPSAAKLENEAVRTIIRDRVSSAFDSGEVREHPGHPERRMITFNVGQEKMYLALGPNETDFPGEWAVIGVLFDREMGQKGTGATIGDLLSDDVKQELAKAASIPKRVRYLVRVGGASSKEIYEANDNDALKDLLSRRGPRPDEVEIFERRELAVRYEVVIEPKK